MKVIRPGCSKTVPEPLGLRALGLALSEKQIPQVVGNNESRTESMEYLEAVIALVRLSLRPVNPFAYCLNETSFYECLGHRQISLPEFTLDDYPHMDV